MRFSVIEHVALATFQYSSLTSCAKLLTGGTIIAFDDDGTDELRVIRDGSILIEGDRIASVYDIPCPAIQPGSIDVIDCTDKIITPGFIDTHRHGWQTVFKTLGSNTTLAEYLFRFSAFVAQPLFTPDDVYISQLAGIYEALNAGVTTILDHAHHTWTRERSEAGLKATVDSGARVFFAYDFQNSPGFSIQDRITHWKELATRALGRLTTLAIAYDAWSGDPRNPDTIGVMDLALESNAKALTTHHVEGPWAIGHTPEDLYRIGILNTSIPIIISHASFVTAKGAELLRQTNQYISITAESEMHYGHLNPTSHLSMDQASLGVDTHFTFSTDILTQARLWLQTTRYRLFENVISRWRIPVNNPMSVNQAFLLATRSGGLALKRPDLGVIAPNAKADIIVWDGSSPAMLGWSDPVAAVILHASVGDIHDVLVGGEFRKRNRRLVVEGYDEVHNRFLETAKRIQDRLKKMPPPVMEGSFFTGSLYAPVPQADVQRGEGTGYGQSHV